MMTTASGGVAAAAGLGFQYLATVDALLEHLETHDDDFELTTEDPRNEVIDFSLSIGGEVQLSVQAKASVDGPDGKLMSSSEITAAAVRLVQDPAERYEIRTNRRLTQDAVTLVDTLHSIDRSLAPVEVRHVLAPAGAELLALSDACLSRLARLDVVSTGEPDEEFAERITGRIHALRRARSHGGGRDSAHVLMRYLVAEVLHRSGRRTGRTLGRDAALELLGLSDRSLAHCLGRYDSGNLRGPFPTLQTVPRAGLLDEVLGNLGVLSTGRTVRKLALQGLSGTGKSSLAASFCEISATAYDRMLWIDASSALAVTDQIARELGEPVGEVTTEEIAPKFRDLLAESPDSWVIVFDNAPDARVISTWLPARGHVDVIATSTNSAAWSTWRRIDVDVMTEAEAVDVVRLRLQLGPLTDEQHASAVRLVRAVERWPLAVELACSFLAKSGRELELTDEYVLLLRERIIDDASLIPPEYRSHPTLLQAIFVALDAVGDAGHSASGLDATAMLDVLAYLPPRSAPIRLAGRIALVAERQRGPSSAPLLDGDALHIAIDGAVGHLAAASLVQRYDSPDGLGPRARTNAIVLDLVRQLHDDEDRTTVLVLLQATLSHTFFEALEQECYPVTAALVASSKSALGYAARYRLLTLDAVFLTGNLGNFWLRCAQPERALHAFGEELALLDDCDIAAPPLRAKIHAAVLQARLQLNAGSDDLASSIDLALSAMEQAASAEQEAPDDFAEVAGQLIEALHALQNSELFTRRDQIDEWRTRVLTMAPTADKDRARREVEEALRDPDNDDQAALRFYEAELATATGVLEYLDLLFRRADALALLRRYEEAAEAFRHAIALSREQSLGLAPGWVSVLNAWRSSSLKLLADVESRAGVRHLVDALDVAVGNDQPPVEDDRETLILCRAAQVVEEAPLDVVTARMAALDGVTFRPTHLTRNTEAARIAVQACRKVFTLRKRLGGAPVFRLRGWRRQHIQLLDFSLFILAVDTVDAVDAPHLMGRWVIADDGVGLWITGSTSAIVWTTIRETGWLEFDDAPESQGGRRLHEIISEYVASAGPASVFVTGKSVADVVEEDVAVGPLVAVAGSVVEL